MYSISKQISNIYIIKKSKFICNLYPINSDEEAKQIIENLRQEYDDATHVCYGYIIDNTEKYSDDKEPTGTAGLPILNTLKAKHLDHILCVVIRYFGGVKLGAGGLSRAYSTSVKETINIVEIIEMMEGYLIEIEFDYSQTKLIDYMLNNKKIVDKQYLNNTIYKFYLSKDELNFIPELEKTVIHLSINDKVWIEKSIN